MSFEEVQAKRRRKKNINVCAKIDIFFYTLDDFAFSMANWSFSRSTSTSSISGIKTNGSSDTAWARSMTRARLELVPSLAMEVSRMIRIALMSVKRTATYT